LADKIALEWLFAVTLSVQQTISRNHYDNSVAMAQLLQEASAAHAAQVCRRTAAFL
jgi:hypothetical protein